MSKIISSQYQKILWIAVGIFGLSGILPWFIVDFPIGTLNISIFDIVTYFGDPQKVPIDFYSSAIYGLLLSGWIFGLAVLIVTAIFQKTKLLFFCAALITGSSIIWAVVAPYLRVQIIFLSLANQPINSEQFMGPGEVAAIIAGLVVAYVYVKSKLK